MIPVLSGSAEWFAQRNLEYFISIAQTWNFPYLFFLAASLSPNESFPTRSLQKCKKPHTNCHLLRWKEIPYFFIMTLSNKKEGQVIKTMALLDVKNVKKIYTTRFGGNQVEALHNVSFSVEAGEYVAIMGESGSGKSVTSLTIMNLLAGNGKVISGDVTLNEKSLLKLSGKEKRQLYGDRIGMIFQDPTAALDPLFTVEQLLLEGLRKHRRMSKKQAREAALESLRMMNLRDPEELMKKKPYELSGGMCQRVMIAIAMSMKPDYLIADEPTTALDVTVQKQILEEIYQLSRKENLGVLFITHDLGVVAEIADDVSIMKDGEIVENGTVEEIFYHPQHSYTKKLLDAVL